MKALKEKAIKKIILSRPAVEAGEKLGFLPGDMKDKIDPYLQPLYDALEDMIPATRLQDMMEKHIIQIAPLAFMRGRTLSDAVVILDEAQNTTPAQIRMFLTRMGWNTKMIITGDMTQIDLPREQKSGGGMWGGGPPPPQAAAHQSDMHFQGGVSWQHDSQTCTCQ